MIDIKSEKAKYLAYLYDHHDGEISLRRILQCKKNHKVSELIKLGIMEFKDGVYFLNARGCAIAESLTGRIEYNTSEYAIIFDKERIMKAAHKSRWFSGKNVA